MGEIILPNNWWPRWYQEDLWRYLENGGKRGVVVCHRRWGKDDIALHWTCTAAHQRVASYWHMLPEYEQARKAIWTAVNPHTGKRRIDEAFPIELRKKTNEQGMFIEFLNGSTWQVIGSDNYNSLVGAPPAGLVVSEWALADPAAWAYLSPILMENGGWALFLYTSRGKNHGFDLYRSALRRQGEGWFVTRQTVTETGVFNEAALEEAKQDLIALYGEDDGEALFQQEYFCSFEAAVIGSYYGRLIANLEQAGRITRVAHDPSLPVSTGWDLGVDDATAVWFVQVAGREVRVIDHLETRGRALTEIAREVARRPYVYRDHYMPHDISTREMTTAKTRRETIEGLLPGTIRPGSQLPVQDGINAVRNLLPRCVFDAEKCEKGLAALREYKVEFDNKTKTPRKTPLHNWASHSADGFRELAVQLIDWEENAKHLRTRTMQGIDYDPFQSPHEREKEIARREIERTFDLEDHDRRRYRPPLGETDYDPFSYH